MENIVFNLLGTFDGRGFVHDILEDELIEMNKFIEFNHFQVDFEFDIPLRFLGIFTPNVKGVAFFNEDEDNVRIAKDNYDDYNIDIVFQHLPNIETIFFFDFEMSKLFEKINRDFGPTLAKVHFYFYSEDENYDLLAEVMRKQSSNSCFYVTFLAKQPDVYQMLDEQSDDENLDEQSDDQSLASSLEFNMKKLRLYFEPVDEPVLNRIGLEFYYYGAKHYFVLRDFPGVCDEQKFV
uniref:DUF38 domain-containing protein n=1 Tax=Panagrolaimus sp. JU765 TaxID=591449 RepID=A0AC34REK1_9BILA